MRSINVVVDDDDAAAATDDDDDDHYYICNDDCSLKGTLPPKTLKTEPILLDPPPRVSNQGEEIKILPLKQILQRILNKIQIS